MAGCSPTSSETATPNSASRRAEDLEAIEAQSRRLSDAYVQGDIETLVSIYSPEGVAVPGNRDFIRGREALHSLWTLPEGRTILRHASIPTEIQIDGDHAYDWGHYEGQAAQNGQSLDPFRGAYVIVWERGEDGTWRIAVDMWNSLRD
jgi:ketosteroid isomerase-like protein